MDIVLEVRATSAKKTLKINKYFENAYLVDWWDWTTWNLTTHTTHTYATSGTYNIILSLTWWADRWTFQNVSKPLVPKDWTTVTEVKITSMPSLAGGFGANATAPWNYFFDHFNRNWAIESLSDESFKTDNIETAGYNFFSYFNSHWAITSLPEWSFKTDNIETAGYNFFSYFNSNWKLTSLPEWSFRFSTWLTTVGNEFFSYFNSNWALIRLPDESFKTENITTVGYRFFSAFNANWQLTSLPTWSFKIDNIETVGHSFFSAFNNGWKLRSLPVWSFNTSNITTAGGGFFEAFNGGWQLTSLPEWSFDTSNITTVGNNFFSSFNDGWKLWSLPVWSFKTENIKTAGEKFFSRFNYNWALTSLPAWSFKIDNISWSVGTWFFSSFNAYWALVRLPDESFKTDNISWSVGSTFFDFFNRNWALTSLPEWSFKIDNITIVGNNFFAAFNEKWALESLPAWSFKTENIKTVGDSFFHSFNLRWAITSLPEWSFDLSHITTVGNYFFSYFNSNWALIRLPEWSFDLSHITTVGNYFFSYFNSNWALIRLPEWSFDLSHITTVGNYFFSYFNNDWHIITIPDSFKLTSVAYNKTNAYYNAFNSSNYTFNRNVSELVEWITPPSSDRDTFSDNQLWKCGVDDNWLVNPNNACKPLVIYNSNGWSTTPSSVMVEKNTQILLPNVNREGYTFIWWYTELEWWERVWWYNSSYMVTEDIILYAHWEENPTVTFDANGWTTVPSQSMEKNEKITKPNNPKKEWWVFAWWYKDKELIDEWDFDNDVVTEDMTLYAKRGIWWITYIPEKELIKIQIWDKSYYIRDKNVWAEITWWLWDYMKFELIEYNLESYIQELSQNWQYATEEEMLNSPEFLWYCSEQFWKEITTFDGCVGEFNNTQSSLTEDSYFANEKSRWNYYFWWNNNSAKYEEFNFWDQNKVTLPETLVERWFTGAKIENLDAWWREWENNSNLCDASKWEYLPTANDWENVMTMWSNIRWYSIFWEDGSDYKVSYIYDDIKEFPFSMKEFQEELMIPEMWGIYKNWENLRRVEVPPLWTALDDEENLWLFYVVVSDDDWYFYELKKDSSLMDEISIYAWQVRCFVNPINVTFDSKWWSSVQSQELFVWDKVEKPSNPSKTWYTFAWWYKDENMIEEFDFDAETVSSEITLYAKWNEKQQEQPSWNNYSGWWGSRSSSPSKADTHGSAEDNPSVTKVTAPFERGAQESANDGSPISKGDTFTTQSVGVAERGSLGMENYNSNYSTEMQQAYNFAKANWITTQSNIKNANMDWKLTRIQMAKMLSYYAINVLGQKPDLTKWTHKFVDVSVGLDNKYDNWVSLAYNLWIMWQNMQHNKFRPNSYVTRAEFVTALSRMIYGIKDGTWKTKYYEPHMNKLKKEWVITNTNPNMKESRGYVMLMLMRSAK